MINLNVLHREDVAEAKYVYTKIYKNTVNGSDELIQSNLVNFFQCRNLLFPSFVHIITFMNNSNHLTHWNLRIHQSQPVLDTANGKIVRKTTYYKVYPKHSVHFFLLGGFVVPRISSKLFPGSYIDDGRDPLGATFAGIGSASNPSFMEPR